MDNDNRRHNPNTTNQHDCGNNTNNEEHDPNKTNQDARSPVSRFHIWHIYLST